MTNSTTLTRWGMPKLSPTGASWILNVLDLQILDFVAGHHWDWLPFQDNVSWNYWPSSPANRISNSSSDWVASWYHLQEHRSLHLHPSKLACQDVRSTILLKQEVYHAHEWYGPYLVIVFFDHLRLTTWCHCCQREELSWNSCLHVMSTFFCLRSS